MRSITSFCCYAQLIKDKNFRILLTGTSNRGGQRQPKKAEDNKAVADKKTAEDDETKEECQILEKSMVRLVEPA